MFLSVPISDDERHHGKADEKGKPHRYRHRKAKHGHTQIIRQDQTEYAPNHPHAPKIIDNFPFFQKFASREKESPVPFETEGDCARKRTHPAGRSATSFHKRSVPPAFYRIHFEAKRNRGKRKPALRTQPSQRANREVSGTDSSRHTPVLREIPPPSDRKEQPPDANANANGTPAIET